MKLEIIDSETLRKIPGTQREVKGNRRYHIFNFHNVIYTTLAAIALTAIMTGVIVSGAMSGKTKTLRAELDILKSEKMSNEHVNMLITKSGKYAIAGKQEIPVDSLIKIYEFACKSDAWYPEVIFAQAVLESANGKSELARTCNNLFGMKQASTRPNTQINYMVNNKSSLGQIYGIYMNWQHSVIDRILWDEWVFSGEKPSREKYIKKIGDIYAEDKQYINKLNKIIVRYFGN